LGFNFLSVIKALISHSSLIIPDFQMWNFCFKTYVTKVQGETTIKELIYVHL